MKFLQKVSLGFPRSLLSGFFAVPSMVKSQSFQGLEGAAKSHPSSEGFKVWVLCNTHTYSPMGELQNNNQHATGGKNCAN
jgi:hypothetical protein